MASTWEPSRHTQVLSAWKFTRGGGGNSKIAPPPWALPNAHHPGVLRGRPKLHGECLCWAPKRARPCVEHPSGPRQHPLSARVLSARAHPEGTLTWHSTPNASVLPCTRRRAPNQGTHASALWEHRSVEHLGFPRWCSLGLPSLVLGAKSRLHAHARHWVQTKEPKWAPSRHSRVCAPVLSFNHQAREPKWVPSRCASSWRTALRAGAHTHAQFQDPKLGNPSKCPLSTPRCWAPRRA